MSTHPPCKELDDQTKDWTMRAARGETPWVCADCGASFSAGMPDTCAYGHEQCDLLLARDKAAAAAADAEGIA